MNSVRFALIGAGGIAQTYAAAFARSANAQLVAVVDSRPAAAKALAEPAGALAFPSVSEFLAENLAAEAAIVCTPPDTHESIVTDLARAGLAILCEKPFTRTPAAARRMVAEARRAGVVLSLAAKFHFTADIIAARAMLARGDIGSPNLVEIAFTGRTDMTTRWNANPDVSGGGVVADNAPHAVGLIRHLLGPITHIHAVEGPRLQPLAVEDNARLFARTAVAPATVDLSWSLDKHLSWYTTIFGTAGTIQVGWKESRWQPTGQPWQVFGSGYDKVAAFEAQLQNMAEAVRGMAPVAVTPDDALANVDTIDAAYQALAASRWQPVGSGGVESSGSLTRTPPPAFGPRPTSTVANA